MPTPKPVWLTPGAGNPPAWPLLAANPMLDWISIDQLHLACLAAGLIALPIALMRARADARASR